MEIYSLTDIGAIRKENQDNYWASVLNVNGKEAGVICLCDGMGGLLNGGYASSTVVKAVRSYILSNFYFEGIFDVVRNVNSDIVKVSNGDKSKAMGTTCTLIVCYDGIYKIFHIGDSRAYLLRNNTSTLLTNDHSAIKEYNISKDNSPDLYNKYKNKLTKCIGVMSNIEPDYYEGKYFEGDKFLLCSDGCWHYLDDIGKISDDTIKDLKGLFENCINYGETDNMTAGVLCI